MTCAIRAVLVHHFDDGHPREQACIVRLAAGSRVEGGAVQINAAAVVGGLDYGSLKFGEIGIGVVEALGHQTHSKAPFFQAQM